MALVGGSTSVSGELSGTTYFTAEAVRYVVACLLLVGVARARGYRVVLPRRDEWPWLAGVAATGLVVFNIALVEGSRHAEPAVLGVAVACVPPVLAVIGPLISGSKPNPTVFVGALGVTLGAVLVAGVGRTDGFGLIWTVVVFVCEAAFTLLALPVLDRHGPWGVSIHACWIAALLYAIISLSTSDPRSILRLTGNDWLAITYLAIGVTALAFVLWYSNVAKLGAGRAGLFTGIAPIAAGFSGMLFGKPIPSLPVWCGITVVLGGLTLGLLPERWRIGRFPRSTSDTTRRTNPPSEQADSASASDRTVEAEPEVGLSRSGRAQR